VAPKEESVEAITRLGLVAIAGILVTAVPLLVAIPFAFRPNERQLGLMRPLTLAGIFAATANTAIALAGTFLVLSRRGGDIQPGHYYAMLAETTVVPFLSFVLLSTAWLCIALGMRRQRE
jgi:hypothetical protein